MFHVAECVGEGVWSMCASRIVHQHHSAHGTCRATHEKDGVVFMTMKEGVGKWARDSEGCDAFDRVYEIAMGQLYSDPTDFAAGEIEFQLFSAVAIPPNADPRAPSKMIVARASHKFHQLGAFYIYIVVRGETSSREECEWCSCIAAFLRVKAPHGDGRQYVDLVLMRNYWQQTTNGDVDTHGDTQFPLLRWSEDRKDEGMWGLCDLACILRVIHLLRTRRDFDNFQIDYDAPVKACSQSNYTLFFLNV